MEMGVKGAIIQTQPQPEEIGSKSIPVSSSAGETFL